MSGLLPYIHVVYIYMPGLLPYIHVVYIYARIAPIHTCSIYIYMPGFYGEHELLTMLLCLVLSGEITQVIISFVFGVGLC